MASRLLQAFGVPLFEQKGNQLMAQTLFFRTLLDLLL